MLQGDARAITSPFLGFRGHNMLTTDRLILRQWREEDKEPFAAMNADEEVMRYFPSVQTREQSDRSVDRFRAHIDEYGFGLWAAVLREGGRFIGLVGIQHAPALVPCSPAVEVGWRLDRSVWGQGLAPEGARAALAYGFAAEGLNEIVSFTAAINTPSARVMEKIGMTRDKDGDFDHPMIAAGHRVQPHILFRINNESLRY